MYIYEPSQWAHVVSGTQAHDPCSTNEKEKRKVYWSLCYLLFPFLVVWWIFNRKCGWYVFRVLQLLSQLCRSRQIQTLHQSRSTAFTKTWCHKLYFSLVHDACVRCHSPHNSTTIINFFTLILTIFSHSTKEYFPLFISFLCKIQMPHFQTCTIFTHTFT